jgi:hypothetical protein
VLRQGVESPLQSLSNLTVNLIQDENPTIWIASRQQPPTDITSHSGFLHTPNPTLAIETPVD